MITYVENIKDIDEFNELTKEVGWGTSTDEIIQTALDNTLYSVSAYDFGKIVGYGRLIGDETRFLYIQDLMVSPDYQHRSIGTTIMNMLMDKVKEYQEINPYVRTYVGPDFNKEGFYRQFGFITRKEAHLGPGMIYKPSDKDSKLYNWEDGIVEEELDDVIETLNNGGIVIFPTDTVYGMGCNCFNEKAIGRLFDIKKRPYYKPINILTDSYEKIEKVTTNINELEKKMIEKYMPGSLTIILKKNEAVPAKLTGGLDTLGVRIPGDSIASEILKRLDYPLATTSANISGNPDGIKIEDFINDFDGDVDIIIDGGQTKLKKPSTIIQIEGKDIKVIRQGKTKVEKN